MSTALIQVPFEIVQKWQEIVNIIAEIIHVPSALVMKVEPPNIKVFASSESNGNLYEKDELAPLNTGLYCETVLKTRQSLLVPDALRDAPTGAPGGLYLASPESRRRSPPIATILSPHSSRRSHERAACTPSSPAS